MGDRATAINFFNQGAAATNDKSNPQNLTTGFQLFVSAAYADPLSATVNRTVTVIPVNTNPVLTSAAMGRPARLPTLAVPATLATVRPRSPALRHGRDTLRGTEMTGM